MLHNAILTRLYYTLGHHKVKARERSIGNVVLPKSQRQRLVRCLAYAQRSEPLKSSASGQLQRDSSGQGNCEGSCFDEGREVATDSPRSGRCLVDDVVHN